MQPDQSLAELTAALVTAFAVTIADMPPDRLLVQGDTTTAFAAALAAYFSAFPSRMLKRDYDLTIVSIPFPRRSIAVTSPQSPISISLPRPPPRMHCGPKAWTRSQFT